MFVANKSRRRIHPYPGDSGQPIPETEKDQSDQRSDLQAFTANHEAKITTVPPSVDDELRKKYINLILTIKTLHFGRERYLTWFKIARVG